MGWFTRSRIKHVMAKQAKVTELRTKTARAETAMQLKQPGAVKLTEEIIKLAKQLGYEKPLIRAVETHLKNYKLDTPKSQW